MSATCNQYVPRLLPAPIRHRGFSRAVKAVELNEVAVPTHCAELPVRDEDWGGGSFPQPALSLDLLRSVREGIVIVDERQKILFINECAQAVVRGSGQLRIEDGRLEGVTPDPRAALRSFLQQCGQAKAAGQLLRLGADVWLRVLSQAPRADGEPAVTALALGSLLGGVHLKGASLRQFFRMTEAEAFVAMALAAGRTATWIAKERRVSVNTVRTQVRIVLRKAGADRIADLVRIVASLPVSPDGHGH